MKISIVIVLNILLFTMMPQLAEARQPEQRLNDHCFHHGNKSTCEKNALLATVFGPRTFVRNTAKPKPESVVFQIPSPQGGMAILEITTGNVHDEGLLASSEIILNGRNVLNHQDAKLNSDNKIEIPVFLRSGSNILVVELRGKPNGKLIVKIQALVDHIQLKPIDKPLILGFDNLLSEATVTALGVPAAGISVNFAIAGLGTIADVASVTDASGKAKATFNDFPLPGKGQIKATVKDSKRNLNDLTAIEIIDGPRIALQQSQQFVTVKEGQKTSMTTTIEFIPNNLDSRAFNIVTQQFVTPNDRGVSLSSIDAWTSAETIKKTIPITISGNKAGTYQLITTVMVFAEGAIPTDKPVVSASADITVGVFNSQIEQPIFLSPPVPNPYAIPPSAGQNVIFSTLVTGTDSPPTTITLFAVDALGQRNAIGTLFDNGENGDRVKGDGFYSATFTVDANIEGNKSYVAKAQYERGMVESLPGSLMVTSLPIGPKSTEGVIAVTDPDTGQQFAPSEVLVTFKSNVSRSEILNIRATQSARIIGTLPSIDVLEVSIPGDSALDVRRAVANFRNLPQVEFAEPNTLLAAGAVIDPITPKLCPTPQVNSQADLTCDWAAIKIGADKAWSQWTGQNVLVAVVDNLYDQHGPLVASLVGGSTENGNTGVAPKASVPTLYYNNHQSYQTNIVPALEKTSQVKVINLSIWEEVDPNGRLNLTSLDIQAVCNKIQATTTKPLFLIMAGNHGSIDKPILVRCVKGENDSLLQGIHAISNAIVVGATDYKDRKAEVESVNHPPAIPGQASKWDALRKGSGYGDWVDIAAPGENVYACDISNNCNLVTGTSYAAPLVSGAAALLYEQNPLLESTAIKTRLLTYSKPLGNAFCSESIEESQCAGRLDVISAIASQAITVAEGFKVRVVATGLPVGTVDALQDIAPNQGGNYGDYLYFIRDQNQIWRVDTLGGVPELFSTITPAAVRANIPNPRLTVLSFGFSGELFAVDGNTNPGRVFRIMSNGTPTLFSQGVQTASEGIAYNPDPSSAFGNKLFLSEFDSSPSRISAIDSDGNVSNPGFAQLANSNRLTGLAFGPGGRFGSELFGVDHQGTIFKIAANGSYSRFAADPPIGQNETLAFGSLDPNNPFGENLYVAPDGKGQIIKINPDWKASVFASGFAGFDFRGVTGLKFSPDQKTFFVTDDNAGIIYAITEQ